MSDRRVVLRRLRSLKRRLDRATTTLAQVEHERALLYLEARELDPPMTYSTIAAVFGVTEAAVMQKVTRHQRAKP